MIQRRNLVAQPGNGRSLWRAIAKPTCCGRFFNTRCNLFYKLKTKLSQKRGQAIVEFALVLPLLLLLVVGLIEAGRAIFIYSSVTNASREAARYASAYGVNADGVPRYQDCAGIRAEAARTGFYLAMDDIEITYDKGLDMSVDPPVPIAAAHYTCVGDTDPLVVLECGDRVTVTINETYSPMLNLIPLKPQDIVSSSSRTFLGVITMEEGFCGTEILEP